MPGSIASRSISPNTMVAFLPPSSSDSRLNMGAALRAISRPVTVPPVKEMAGMSGWPTMAAPADAPSPCTTLRTPGGSPCSAVSRAEHRCRERRQLRGLGDHGVAGRDGGRDLPREQVQRQVPGRDEARHAAWLPQHVVEGTVVGGIGRRLRVQDGRREEPQVGHGAWDVQPSGERDRLAGIGALRLDESLEVLLQRVRDAQQDARSLRCGCRRPAREGGLCGDRRRVPHPLRHLRRSGRGRHPWPARCPRANRPRPDRHRGRRCDGGS